MAVELRQLRYFVAVAEELHFSRAAERVYLSQPALSQQVQRLETFLGVRLLERNSKKVELTEAGRVLLQEARKVLMQVDHALRETRRAGGQSVQRLTLGYVEYGTFPIIAPVIRRFEEHHADVQLERYELYPAQFAQALLEGKIDIGIGVLPSVSEALTTETLFRGHWTVILPDNHRLTSHGYVSLTELAKERLILFARRNNPPLFDAILAQCHQAWGYPPTVVETSQVPAGVSMVLEGLGVFLVNSFATDVERAGVMRKRVIGLADFEMGAMWRREDNNPNLPAFVEALKSA